MPQSHRQSEETLYQPASTSSAKHAAISFLRSVTKTRFCPIDTYPEIVAFVQTAVGKILLLIAFASLLAPLTRMWLPVTVASGVCAYSGRFRSIATTVGTLGVLLIYYIYRP